MSAFVFNFKGQFADAVRIGAKTQTCRANRRDGRVPILGDVVKLYRGLRTKDSELLGVGRVWSSTPIVIDWWTTNGLGIYFAGKRLDLEEADAFARADGFPAGAMEMLKFMKEAHKDRVKLEGWCCMWRLEHGIG